MKCSYMVIPDEELVVFVMRGTVNYKELLQATSNLIKDPEYRSFYRFFLDFRKLRSLITVEEGWEFREQLDFIIEDWGQVVILADKALTYRIERPFDFILYNKEYVLTASIQRACQYLKLPEEFCLDYPTLHWELLSSANVITFSNDNFNKFLSDGVCSN